MPIYEYRCESCGHEFDALQKMNDENLSDCPECTESALKRLMSAPSFRLKGSGWYETDFKSDQEQKRNLVDTGSDKPASGTDGEKPAGGEKPASGEKSDGGEKSAKADKPASADKPKSETKISKTSSSANGGGKKPGPRGKGSGSEAA